VLSKVELTDGERLVLEELNAVPLGPTESIDGAMSPVARIWKRLEDQGSTSSDSGFVRSAISKIRAKLDSFSKSPTGLFEDVRIQILHNTRRDERFHFKVERNHLPPGASAFWASHLRTGSPLNVVIGQPIFFGSTSGLLVRDYLSDAQQMPPWVRTLFNGLSGKNEPDDALCTIPRIAPFAATQDFRGALALLRYFDRWQIKGHPAPEFFGARESESKDRRFTNAVFLGSPFENPFIWDLDCNWYDTRIEGADRAAGDSHVLPMKEYWDTEQQRQQLPGSTAERRKAGFYASLILDKLTASEGDVVVVVSRLSNAERTITCVESLDPMAVRVICDVLADEREMAQVISTFGIDVPWKGFPNDFEMSFVLRVPKTTEEFAVQVRAECWGSRVLHMVKTLEPQIVCKESRPIKREEEVS
jgi:hypothetical protein